MARSLQDRLREVQERGSVEPEEKKGADSWEVGPGLRRGDESAVTSLKARLQALVDQQVRSRRTDAAPAGRPSHFELDSADSGFADGLGGGAQRPRVVDVYNLEGPPEDLAALIGGEVVTSAHGEFLLRDARYRLDSRVGRSSLEKLANALPDAARILTASVDLEDFDPRKAAFIDTETTGLSGGAGTAAFLVAVGFLEGDAFIVRQYFMRDFHEERALIRAVERDLERFDTIVSFNGKQFDVPLLESRFRLQRRVFRQTARHLDMLHPGRRLWKARLESCSLQSLERGVMGFHRDDDIPGAFIPERYFEYLRRKDGRLMVQVLEHNLQDIVSLAALTGEALAMVAQPGALPEDAFDVLSLGRVLERAELDERSEEAYRAIAETGTGRARVDATVRLAYRAKARKHHDEAERLWRIGVALASAIAHRELAMLLEHTRKDKVEALRIVDEGLELVVGRSDFATLEDDLLKRRARLTRAGKAAKGSTRRE
jgi:uncharacterized protein YprB with RNaseH-like and TPR domain